MKIHMSSLLQKMTAYVDFRKLALISVLGIIFMLIPKAYLGETYPICLFRIFLNKHCLGCGTTRAVWSVLHFQFIEAYEYNKMIIITFPLLVGCFIKWILIKKQ